MVFKFDQRLRGINIQSWVVFSKPSNQAFLWRDASIGCCERLCKPYPDTSQIPFLTMCTKYLTNMHFSKWSIFGLDLYPSFTLPVTSLFSVLKVTLCSLDASPHAFVVVTATIGCCYHALFRPHLRLCTNFSTLESMCPTLQLSLFSICGWPKLWYKCRFPYCLIHF